MCFKFGGYLIPILPEKNFLTKINLENEQFKEARKKDLVEFIEDILTHNKLRYSQDLKAFLFDTEKAFAIFKEEQGQLLKEFTDNDIISQTLTNFSQFLSKNVFLIPEYQIVKPDQSFKKLINYSIYFNQLISKIQAIFKAMKKFQVATTEEVNSYNKLSIYFDDLIPKNEQEFQIIEDQSFFYNSEKLKQLMASHAGNVEIFDFLKLLSKQTEFHSNILVNQINELDQQLLSQINKLVKDICSANLSLHRQKSLYQYVKQDNQTIKDLQILNKQHNSKRNKELDYFLNRYKKNKMRLKQNTEILLVEMEAFKDQVEDKLPLIFKTFNETQNFSQDGNQMNQSNIVELM